MRSHLALFVVFFLAPAGALHAGWDNCYTTMTLLPQFARITAIARCSYETFGVQDNSVTISINHTVTPGNGTDVCQAQGYCGTSLDVSPYAASTTYQSNSAVTASQLGISISSRTDTYSLTTPDPIRPHNNEPIILCDDGSYTGNCSPIVINLASGPYRLSGPDDPVAFDIDADGVKNQITWTGRGEPLAFLALDRNGNLSIDDGSELFGTATRLQSGVRAGNGFDALAELDVNVDGVVSALDPAWASLVLWVDHDHDGISGFGETTRIADSTFESISTKYRWTGRRDPHGNEFRYQGHADRAGKRRPIYDIYFRVVR